MLDKTEIAVMPPKESALQVFTAPKGLDPYLAKVRGEIDAFTPDVSTKRGRDAVASIAYKVAQSKTALDKMGKELVSELKEKPKLVDAERKRMRDMLDEWRDEVRRPLTEWENAEQARIEKHKEFIAKLSNTENLQWCESSVIRELIAETTAIVINESLEEFEAEAHRAKEAKMKVLTDALVTAGKREAEQAELERLRKEQAEREEADRIERIRREAIETERLAAEKRATEERERIEREREAERKATADRERQHQLEIERANREKAEAEACALREKEAAEERQRQAVENERLRIEAEREAAEAEAERKASNRAHQQKINREALADMETLGIDAQMAKKLISDIARGSIRNITINY